MSCAAAATPAGSARPTWCARASARSLPPTTTIRRMILAAFRLVAEGVLPLPKAWDLISAAPANAAGLERPRRACGGPPRGHRPGRRGAKRCGRGSSPSSPPASSCTSARRSHRRRMRRRAQDRGSLKRARCPARRATPSIMCPPRTLRSTGSAPRCVGYDAFAPKDLDHPPQALHAFADWHELTADPRKYGFHATLKAPFLLADGADRSRSLRKLRPFRRRRRGTFPSSRRSSARSAASSPSCRTLPVAGAVASSPTTA